MATSKGNPKLPATPWGQLPPRMRVLFITGSKRTGAWLATAFAGDSATEVLLEESIGAAAGMARLRDDVFDAVLISHEPGDIDALKLLDAVRAGSGEQQPVIVLGVESEQEMTALCFEAGADAYVCVNSATIRTLIWHLARAIERDQLIVENRRLRNAERHRLQLEHEEANRRLRQQRSLLENAAGRNEKGRSQGPMPDKPREGLACQSTPQVVDTLLEHYRELLRAYVIMGSGNLAEEMSRLAELMSSAGMSPRQAMHLHLHVLEEMIHNLGSRSARHVMNRADLLAQELVVALAERNQYDGGAPRHLREDDGLTEFNLETPAA